MKQGAVIKFIARWVVATISIYAIAWLFPGIIQIDDFSTAIWAGLALGFLNAIVRPILIVFTLPATILTLGLFILVINALMLYLVGALVAGVHVTSFGSAFLGALLISILSSVIHFVLFPEERRLHVQIKRNL
ncbi:phage holin family protein [Candidatus Acetothermia bacterium]|nr:phage holin family protein [Candidatus Acetothermia bacterium]MBI3643284.1 phage holin family protein [Candidatus Acetothermia bacterium]